MALGCAGMVTSSRLTVNLIPPSPARFFGIKALASGVCCGMALAPWLASAIVSADRWPLIFWLVAGCALALLPATSVLPEATAPPAQRSDAHPIRLGRAGRGQLPGPVCAAAFLLRFLRGPALAGDRRRRGRHRPARLHLDGVPQRTPAAEAAQSGRAALPVRAGAVHVLLRHAGREWLPAAHCPAALARACLVHRRAVLCDGVVGGRAHLADRLAPAAALAQSAQVLRRRLLCRWPSRPG